MEVCPIIKTSEAVQVRCGAGNGETKLNWVMETGEKMTTDRISPNEMKHNTIKRFSFSAYPMLEEIWQRQADFTDERDWNQFHQPCNLLLALVGEVGAEHFQWRGEVAEGLTGWTDKERQDVSHELSDVLIYLVELAEKCHVDLAQVVQEKMVLNAQKYPASKVHGSAKKYTECKN